MRIYVLLTSLLATALAVAVLALPRVELDGARAVARADIAEGLALFAVREGGAAAAGGSEEEALAAWAEARGVALGLARAGQVTFSSGAEDPSLRAALEDLALRAASEGPGPEDAAAGWLRVNVWRAEGRIVAAGAIPYGEGFVVLARSVGEPAALGPVARVRALVSAGDDAPIEVVGPLAGGLVLLLLGLVLARRPRAERARDAQARSAAATPAAPRLEAEPSPAAGAVPVPTPPPSAAPRPVTAKVAPVGDPWRPDEQHRPAALASYGADDAGSGDDGDDALPEVEPLPAPSAAPAPPAPAPALPLAQVPGSDAPTLETPALSAQELALRVLYDDFMALRARCGEPTSGLNYSAFCETVRRNEASLRARHGCSSVRLEVFENNGRAALRMVPG